jgi:hypothetical protein
MAQLVVACTLPIHAVLQAFRTGDGVRYADYGADLHEGQARFTQPLFDNLLAIEWFPAVPAIHDRLSGEPKARVADLACGHGRSSIAIAHAYPNVTVDEKTAERFALDAGDVERLYYGFSVLHCLPVGMVGQNAAGTGSVMREHTVRAYAVRPASPVARSRRSKTTSGGSTC